MQRQLSALGVTCYVVSPQKLDEREQRVKTDGRDARALCLKLGRYVEGNNEELAVIRVPSEAEEQRAHSSAARGAGPGAHQLQAQGRSLLVNHGEPAQRWWKRRGLPRSRAGMAPDR